MDTTASVREVVKEVIRRYAALRPSHGEIRLDAVLDEAHDRYALVQVGWDRGRRIRGLLLYITVVDNKVCVEYDGMEHGVIPDFVQRGIPENEIVLAYQSEVAV
ncbi:MAG: XisI protein [Pirellulales bacterium]|nr:XisI protein [Pirellulales bacterium]